VFWTFLRLSFDHLSVAFSFHLIKFYIASQIHVWNGDTPEPAANEYGLGPLVRIEAIAMSFSILNMQRSGIQCVMRCSMLPKIIAIPASYTISDTSSSATAAPSPSPTAIRSSSPSSTTTTTTTTSSSPSSSSTTATDLVLFP